MNKVTLAIPSYDSFWLLHRQSCAINVAVGPKKNTISGLFTPKEVNLVVSQFGAVQLLPIFTNSIDPSRQPGGKDRQVWKYPNSKRQTWTAPH
jgi:hypothetical protein